MGIFEINCRMAREKKGNFGSDSPAQAGTFAPLFLAINSRPQIGLTDAVGKFSVGLSAKGRSQSAERAVRTLKLSKRKNEHSFSLIRRTRGRSMEGRSYGC